MSTRCIHKLMPRRAFLRGTGSVIVGLPLLETLNPRFSLAQSTSTPPERFFTLFIGLGIPRQIHYDGWDDQTNIGPLKPILPFANKMTLMRGINMRSLPPGGNAHFYGSGGVFRGGNYRAGRYPSIEQVIARNAYPSNPPTPLHTVTAGTYVRGPASEAFRYIKSWKYDGNRVAYPTEFPSTLFTEIFGSAQPNPPNGQDRAARYRVSVLDSVVEQYRYLMSERGGLSATSKERVRDHLDEVRSLEQRLARDLDPSDPVSTCTQLPHPQTDPRYAQDANFNLRSERTGGRQPLEVSANAWANRWRLMVDIYTAGIACDMFRFGSLLFESAGERTYNTGSYTFADGTTHDFDDMEEHRGGVHENYHGSGSMTSEDFRNSGNYQRMAWHIRFKMDQVAYLLQRLESYSPDLNGQTLLDNAGLLMGTELDNPGQHSVDNVFHAFNGAAGRLPTGGVIDVSTDSGRNAHGRYDCCELYNTVLTKLGISEPMGDPDFYDGDIPEVLNA